MRAVVQCIAICACASLLFLSAAPAPGASRRIVTLTVAGNGKAFWKLDGAATARMSLTYRWHGTVSFAAGGAKISASSRTTLVAAWSGTYRGRKGGALTTCTYGGTKVRARVDATLANGRAPNTLELAFHPRGDGRGFFDDAKVTCTPRLAQTAPPHFAPAWFFRDNLQDHGRLSSQTAILVLPRALLPRGRTSVAFPSETGRNDSPAVGRIAWSNKGRASITAR